MELSFRQALLGVGTVLIAIGLFFGIINSPEQSAQPGIAEALSAGFSAAFFALFSGVMIGVGAVMFVDGLTIGIRGTNAHIALSFLFSLLSAAIAVAAVANPLESNYNMFIVFFAGMASSGAFMLSAAVFLLIGLSHAYLSAPVRKKAKRRFA